MTIVTEIEDLEKEMAKSESRIDEIERLGRLTVLKDEEENRLKEEKTSLETLIVINQKKLTKLRWENSKTMVFSALILGVSYIAFMLFNSSSSDVAEAL